MIKILFLIDSLTGGGAEKALCNLVNSLDQSQFQITVQTVEYTSPTPCLNPGIRYKAMNRAKTHLGKLLFSYWIRLCAELKWLYPLYIQDSYDIEVAFLEAGPTKFLAASTNRNALKFAWVHCDLSGKGISPTQKLRRIYASFDRIVCVSEGVKQSFQQLFGEDLPCNVLYNVIDEQEILQKSTSYSINNKDCFTFLSIGRLAYEKGYDRLLSACSFLKKAGYRFRLLILGEGALRTSLETQIRALDLQDHVQIPGFSDNPYPYMAAADCIVCSSRYEGFSTVVTEALILGKPIVTTPCAGMRELLGSSQFGLITQDSISGIYKGMRTMLEQPRILAQYAAAAECRRKAFSRASLSESVSRFFLEEIRKKQFQS